MFLASYARFYMQKLNLIAVLTETFRLIRQDVKPLLFATLASGIAMAAATFVCYTVIETVLGMPVTFSLSEPSDGFMVLQLIMVIMTAPIEAGLAYIGLQRALGRPVSARAMLDVVPLTAPLLLISLMTGFVSQLGFALFFVLGIGLLVVLSQANLYFVVQRTNPLKSIIDSAKVMVKQLLPLSGAYLVGIIGLLLAFWPMAMVIASHASDQPVDGTTEMMAATVTLAALCWVIPFFFQLKGVVYKHLFVTPETQSSDEASPSEPGAGNGHFEA
ncbi:hypothetical protein SAMN04488540_10660 [Ferrimonas sediminum]|uniref:Membrane domain of glycerophosphoryl diester phosphodiesterase n=2 Tax=Ferrimonas sediminum TaxID=718193 RepID=A0A1G8S3G3_9GAMM|nr:hypothetical protein SAMN04488540_10660 [Ferrimonas sediminum]